MFFRIKKINGKEYAYKVRNKWTDKGPRQKVVGYAGRVFNLVGKKQDVQFKDFVEIAKESNFDEFAQNSDYDSMIFALVAWELARHGCTIDEISQAKITFTIQRDNGKTKAEVSKGSVKSGAKEIVLRINEGYFCSSTLKEIFDAGMTDEDEAGLKFAKSFVSAGIEVPKEVFVKLYEKLS